MKKTKLTTLLILIGMLNLNTISLSEANSCDEKLSACDQALSLADLAIKQQDVVIKTQKEVIGAQDNLIAMQGAQIKDLTAEKRSFLANPWLWFAVGLVTGVVVTNK